MQHSSHQQVATHHLSQHERQQTHTKLANQLGALQMRPGLGMAGAKRARAKQRKWRVLVSIALLLPALAAIIGKCHWQLEAILAEKSPLGEAPN